MVNRSRCNWKELQYRAGPGAKFLGKGTVWGKGQSLFWCLVEERNGSIFQSSFSMTLAPCFLPGRKQAHPPYFTESAFPKRFMVQAQNLTLFPWQVTYALHHSSLLCLMHCSVWDKPEVSAGKRQCLIVLVVFPSWILPFDVKQICASTALVHSVGKTLWQFSMSHKY